MEPVIKNQRAYDALQRGLAQHGANGGIDVGGYPEDTVDTILKVCKLWNLKPPAMKKSKAYWIQSARELREACGEFGVFAIEQVRLDFEKVMEKNMVAGIGGVAPYIVEGPNSLVKVTRAKAGELRSQGEKKPRRYDEGAYAEFIQK